MPHDNHLRPGERVFSVLLVLFAGFVFSEAYNVSGLSGLTTGGVMPMLAAGVMVVSSVCIVADALRKPIQSNAGGKLAWLRYLFPLRIVLFALAIAAYAFLIPSLGFLISSGLFLFVVVWALWRQGPLRALVIAAASVVIIHVLFRMVFQVVLPAGHFWQ